MRLMAPRHGRWTRNRPARSHSLIELKNKWSSSHPSYTSLCANTSIRSIIKECDKQQQDNGGEDRGLAPQRLPLDGLEFLAPETAFFFLKSSDSSFEGCPIRSRV